MPKRPTNAELSDQQVEILLKEYELCLSDAGDLEKYVWTTASVLVPASIAGFAYLGNNISTNSKFIEYFFPIGVSILSIVFIWYWLTMVRRWYSLQRLWYFRASEIEQQLGMYKERYVSALKSASTGKTFTNEPQIEAMITAMKPKFYNKSLTLRTFCSCRV